MHISTINPMITVATVLVLCMRGHVEGLHIRGVWRTDQEFFHFLTKFGFQKTSPQEKAQTEGYIYGNVTSVDGQQQGHTYGTLALLPRQFFLDYYGNRTQASRDPHLACRLMFQDVQKEAFDAKCHDSGREDFLRRVPCPRDQLCPDEDNPSNVIPHKQLTYAVQDINNPRFWYLSLVACFWNRTTCEWQHTTALGDLQYELNVVNGDPRAGDHSPFEYHFSFDKQDTVEIYLVCVVFYGCILVPLQVYAACRQIHPITRLFTATLLVQLAGLMFDTLHLLVYSSDGEGSEGVNIVGDLLNILAQSLFMMLLLLLAKGWAITRMMLSRRLLLFSLWGLYSILILTLYFWNMMEVDVIEDIDEYQTWPGWLTLLLRVLIMVWFLFELRSTMTYEHNTNKLHFFLHFGAAVLVWFVYLPVVALIALQVSPLWRYKLLLGFTYSADLLAHCFMTYMLWPERSEQYLLLAHEADLTELMDEFNEAPHVVNHSDHIFLTTIECDPDPHKVTT